MTQTDPQTDFAGQLIGTPEKKEPAVPEVSGVHSEEDAAPGFRYVRHGEGPCSCCGPYSE